MCGVVSIIYAKDNKNLGKVASFLLKKLEYRGYDSTGAAFVSGDDAITLRKRVGAPSVVTRDLKLDEYSGRKFIGQVRWATFGSVTDTNAQPHEMNCFRHMVGAHNGNIGNTDSLKEFLVAAGHKVLSDNDGEMLIHMVERETDITSSGNVISMRSLSQQELAGLLGIHRVTLNHTICVCTCFRDCCL
jgi:glucosamine--fructose-6-phosphate aminotransferase (isomerizing)